MNNPERLADAPGVPRPSARLRPVESVALDDLGDDAPDGLHDEPSPAATGGLSPAPKLFSAHGLKKSYRKGKIEVPVLHGVDLDVHEGEFLAIIGQSGSGKSTLLHLLGTLDRPDAGEIRFDGSRIDNISHAARDRLRNRTFGMIFQFYHLLPEMSAFENVLTPLMIHHGVLSWWRHRRAGIAKAEELLDLVGLSHRKHHKPRELSGGEMQRAAIARALIHEPRILFADEPTGNLDRGTGQEILRLLRGLNRKRRLTIVMVTHDLAIARQADRIVRLAEGRLETA